MPDKARNFRIFALLILTFLIWSNSFIAIKLLLARMSAFDLVRLRFLPVGVISMALILLFYRAEAWQHPARASRARHPGRLADGDQLQSVPELGDDATSSPTPPRC